MHVLKIAPGQTDISDMAARDGDEDGRPPGALNVVALLGLVDTALLALLTVAIVLGRPLLTAVLLAVAGAAAVGVVAVAVVLASRARTSRSDPRPVVVVADRTPPEADPAFRHAPLRREVGVDLANARLEAARRRGAPLAEVLLLSVAVRRARLDHAEALLAAGADLPEDLLLDLADRGAGPGTTGSAPQPRQEQVVRRRRVEVRRSEGP